MNLYITRPSADRAGQRALRGKVKSFRVVHRFKRNRDGSADYGFAVLLMDAKGESLGALR